MASRSSASRSAHHDAARVDEAHCPRSSSSSSLLCIRACSFQIRFRFRTPIRRTYSAWQGCCSLARSGDAASTTATGRTPNLHRFATPRQAGAHSVLPSGEPTSSRGTCTAAAFGGRRRPQCAGEGPPPRALTTAPATGMRERLQPLRTGTHKLHVSNWSDSHADTTSDEPCLMPSALVLSELLDGHAGDPPLEALEQAGFDRNEADRYLKRRAAHTSGSNGSSCAGN